MEPPAWLDELRIEPGPPFVAMGTHALDLAHWLVVDDERDEQLTYKRQLLAQRRQLVVATHPECAGPSAEVEALITEWLRARGLLPVTEPADAAAHPLVRAALMVQDDLAVLQRIEGEWILTGGVVCFPSHWTIADKVGLPIAEVHGPVAHYDRELRDRVDRFNDRLTVEHPVWRRNWFVVPTPELHLLSHGVDNRMPAQIAPDGSPMWIRSERQTLRRLPGSDAILFTIRVQRAPLGVLRTRPALAAAMLTAVRSWDEPKRAYTSTGGVLGPLIAWLEEQER